MLNICFWLIFGILSGWIVAIIARPEAMAKRAIATGFVGAVGGLLGGGLTQYISAHRVVGGFNGQSIAVSVIAAVILAVLFNAICCKQGPEAWW